MGIHWHERETLGMPFSNRSIVAATLPLLAFVSLPHPASAQNIDQPYASASPLPDAPSAVLLAALPSPPESNSLALDLQAATSPSKPGPPAPAANQPPSIQCPTGPLSNFVFLSQKDRAICQQQDPIQFIVEPGPVKPLTPTQKAILAGRGVIEPFNLITIVGSSGISAGISPDGAYGPGFWHSWGEQIGYSLAEDIQGEATGTWIIPALAHEDPRYHRLPGHPMGQRILHAIGHTVLSQSDDGRIMPNYATLINYPLSALIDDAYVPGVDTSASATAKRIAVGYATDPVGAIVAEFLPDVAKRIHIHIVFVQQILNKIATGTPGQ
jgi:hypothetical protein